MDPRSAKPDSRLAVPREPGDTDSSGTIAQPPLAFGLAIDPFLSPPQQPDEVGRLGPYRILAELGRGGMGVVYRAEDPRLQRAVAVKVLLPGMSADPRAKARFIREAQAQAQVEADNIIPIHGVEEANGVAYIVMPLLKGQTLAAALKQNPRPPIAELVRVGREIALGLAAAHEAGLIHRDIKPGNVWLEGSRRRVKILDFGLARQQARPEIDATEPLTGSGAVLGTPAYMAPEQARSQPVDHRTDLFSLGVVLYEMATGRMPFAGPSVFDVMTAVVAHEPPPVQLVVPECPPALSDLISRLMSKNRDDRPQSAGIVAQELEVIDHSLIALPVQVIPLASIPDAPLGPDPWADIELTQGEEVVHTTPKFATAPRARASADSTSPKKWLWLVGTVVGVIVLVALAGGVWFAVQAFKPKPPQEPVGPPPPPTPKKDKPIDLERRAAEVVLKHGGLVHLHSGDQFIGTFRSGDQLPTGSFRVTGIVFNSPGVLDDALFDGLHGLKGLEEFATYDRSVSDGALARFLASPGAANLQSLTLYSNVTEAALEPLPKLRRLSTVNFRSPKLGDNSLQHLRDLPLTKVDLSNTLVTKKTLAALAGKQLVSLILDGCPDVDDAALEQLKGMTTLTVVSLGATKVGNAGLSHLTSNTNLSSLDLTRTQVTNGGMEHVAQFPKLGHLYLMGLPITHDGLAKLSALQQLAILNLSGTQVADNGLTHLSGMKTLRELSLSGTPVTDEGLPHLAEMKSLSSLSLNGTKVTEAGAKKLATKQSWCRIALGSGQIGPTNPNWVVTDRLTIRGFALKLKVSNDTILSVRKRTEMPNGRFTVIDIANLDTLITDEIAQLIATLPELASFRSVPGHELTDVGLRHLLVLRASLVTLSLDAGPLTDEAMKVVGEFTNLRALSLQKAKFPDASLTHLKGLVALESLTLRASSVTDAGLKGLSEIPNLKSLSLHGTAVSDAALDALAQMKALTNLDLRGTRVTEAGLKKLKTTLPKCQIEWEPPKTP